MSQIKFTADCQLKAAADKPAQVEILAYTGGTMRLPGLGNTIVDLAGMELNQVPLLADHDNHLASIAGTGTPAVSNGTLLVRGTLANGTAAGNQILALHKSGVKLQASIGAEVLEQTTIAAGKSVQVNGKSITAPAGGISLIRKSKLREVSFVAAGADSQTTVSIAARRNRKMEMPFQDWAHSMIGSGFAKLDKNELAQLHANYSGRNEPSTADFQATATFITAGAELDPQERELRRLERQFDHEQRLEALKAKIPLAQPISASRQDADGLVMQAALCLKGGISEPEKHFSERTLEAADRLGRGVGLQNLLMTAACANGYHAQPGEYVTQGNVRQVLTHAFMPIRAAGWSSIAVPDVLSSVANKMLLDGFQEMPSEWRAIAAVKNVNNFKEHTFVRLLDSLEFEQLGAGGEIKHGTLSDDKMTARAATFAKMLSITRTDIINDDLSALTDVPRRLGRAGGQKFNSLFWAGFNAADGFWDAGNSNVVTGSGTALDALGVGLTAAVKAFRAQRTTAADGSKIIGGKPSILLVPPALEIVARRLLNSAAVVSGDNTGPFPGGNPFQGIATLVVEDRLSAAEGGSDSQWYLLRAPSFAPSMLVAALNGRVEPVIETAEADFNVLGISMRGYSDVGVSRGEKLAGLQMEGTT